MSREAEGAAVGHDERRAAGGAGRRAAEKRYQPSAGGAALRDPSYGGAGEPPWRVQKARSSPRWSRDTVAIAMRVVAELNAKVKGADADAEYAMESAVRKVAELVADRVADKWDAGLRILSREPRPRRLLLAAWFWWMTQLVAALSRLAGGRTAATQGLFLIAGLSAPTGTSATAVKQGRLHDLLRKTRRAVSLNELLMRLMLATGLYLVYRVMLRGGPNTRLRLGQVRVGYVSPKGNPWPATTTIEAPALK